MESSKIKSTLKEPELEFMLGKYGIEKERRDHSKRKWPNGYSEKAFSEINPVEW